MCKAKKSRYNTPSLNPPPRNPPNHRIPQPHVPGLRPIQVRVGGLPADQAERMEGIMDGPFALEGVHGAVPDEAVGMPGPDGGQLALKIILAYHEGRLELDVVCRYLVVHM